MKEIEIKHNSKDRLILKSLKIRREFINNVILHENNVKL